MKETQIFLYPWFTPSRKGGAAAPSLGGRALLVLQEPDGCSSSCQAELRKSSLALGLTYLRWAGVVPQLKGFLIPQSSVPRLQEGPERFHPS